jgi:hypothetical protein
MSRFLRWSCLIAVLAGALAAFFAAHSLLAWAASVAATRGSGLP